MRQKLIFKIYVLVLIFFFSSCKHQLFLKRKYTDGFFTEGISKKEKTPYRIKDEAAIANTVFKKTTNLYLAKPDSSNLSDYITNDSQTTDVIESNKVKHQKDNSNSNPIPVFQKPTKSLYVGKQKTEDFDFKHVGLISLISGSLISLGLLRRKKEIKQIAKWAYRNKWKSRFFIAVATILNIGASVVIGDLLKQHDVVLPNHLMEYVASVFGLSLLMYPKKENILFDKTNFIKRKLVHLSLALLSCMMTIISSYNQEPCTKFIKRAMPEMMPINSTLTASKDSKIIKTKWVESNSTKPVEEHKLKWWQGLTIFFIILTAMASTIAIMAFSCYLSCSGQGGVATLLGVGGTALLITLTVYSIVKIAQIKITPKKSKSNNA